MLEKLDSTQPRRPIPFYGSYASFLRGLKGLKDCGIPKRVNPRTMSPILGEEATRVSAWFTSMGWIDEDGRPRQDLITLVEAFGEDSWKETITAVVRKAYSFVPGDWEELTSAKLHAAFVAYTGREAKVMTSAETFFLSLVLECGITLPDRLYLRAERAHTEARRSKTDGGTSGDAAQDDQRDSVETPPALIKNIEAPGKKGGEWANEIAKFSALLSDLSALLIEGDITIEEKHAIATTISVLVKRMNRG